jgi:hypothetical protein
VAYAPPVTGLITSVVAPSAASTKPPLTKFWKVHSRIVERRPVTAAEAVK